MALHDVLTVLAALERAGVRYAVFGGLAMAAHGLDRATLGEAFRFQDLDVEQVRAGDVVITVVTPATLYRMKRDTVRMRDRADAMRLAPAFGLDDETGG